MKPHDPHQVAEIYATGGRVAYERDGMTAPIIALHGVETVVIQPAVPEGREQNEVFAQLVAALSPVIQPDVICVVTEAWHQILPEGRGALEDYRHGDMAREAETNPDVKTAVVAMAINLADVDASVFITNIVHGDPRDPQWETHTLVGSSEGMMKDAIMWGHTNPFPYTDDLEPDLMWVLDILGEMGLIHGAMVGTPNNSQN